MEEGDETGSDVSNKLYKSQIFEPKGENEMVKSSLPSIRNASRTPVLQKPAHNFTGLATTEKKGTKN